MYKQYKCMLSCINYQHRDDMLCPLDLLRCHIMYNVYLAVLCLKALDQYLAGEEKGLSWRTLIMLGKGTEDWSSPSLC